jgi:hypothetical protein
VAPLDHLLVPLDLMMVMSIDSSSKSMASC